MKGNFWMSLLLCLPLCCSGDCDQSCMTCSGTHCATCAVHAHISSSICLCDGGYTPSPTATNCIPAVCPTKTFANPDPPHCTPCDALCAECSGPTALDCTNCIGNAYLIDGSPSQCECYYGYYANNSVCSLCNPKCGTCTGPEASQCTSCPSEGRRTQGTVTSPGFCVCPDGSVPTPAPGQCLLCDATCLLCTGSQNNQCTLCTGNLQLLSPAPGICGCALGYFVSASRKCETCDSTCASCESALGCTGCKAGAQLLTGPNSACVCGEGYFAAPTAANCSMCPRNCLSCLNTLICLRCGEGYFLINQQCQSCKIGCLTCSDPSKCTSCVSGLYLTLAGECVNCPACAQPFTVSVTSPYDHQYLLTFNHNCTYPFTAEDFAITTEPVSNIAWTVTTTSPLVVSVQGGPWYTNTTFHLSFPHPNYIFDIFGSVLTVSSLEIPPPSGAQLLPPSNTSDSPSNTSDTPSASSNTTTLTAQEQSVASASQKSTNAVAAMAMAAGALAGSGAAMALVIQMQYFSFIGSTGVSLPGGMSGMYAGMNQKSMLPNFFSKGKTGGGRRLDTSDVVDFLEEAGSFLSLLALLVGGHLLVRLISLFFRGKLPKILSWALRKCELSLYVDFIGFAYLDLVLNSLSQLYQADFPASDIRTVLNISLSSVVLLLMLLFPLYTLWLLRRNREQLFEAEESGVRRKWEMLVEGIREDIVFAQYFQPVSYVQRFLYACILVFISPGKWLCLGLIFPALWMTAFVVAFRPDESAVQRFLHILSEVQNLLLFVSIFLVKVLTDGTLELGWVIVVLSLGSLMCGVVSFLLDMRERIVTFIRKICCRKRLEVIKAEAYEVTTASNEDQSSYILSINSLYPSHKERQLRGNWIEPGRPHRQLSDMKE